MSKTIDLRLPPTYNTTARVLEVFAIILRSDNKPTKWQLSEQLGICEKTVTRYVKAINEALANSSRLRGLAGVDRLELAKRTRFDWMEYRKTMPRANSRKFRPENRKNKRRVPAARPRGLSDNNQEESK